MTQYSEADYYAIIQYCDERINELKPLIFQTKYAVDTKHEQSFERYKAMKAKAEKLFEHRLNLFELIEVKI